MQEKPIDVTVTAFQGAMQSRRNNQRGSLGVKPDDIVPQFQDFQLVQVVIYQEPPFYKGVFQCVSAAVSAIAAIAAIAAIIQDILDLSVLLLIKNIKPIGNGIITDVDIIRFIMDKDIIV
jgi:hypothetical protein